jgi:hypothetical protein
MCRRGLPHLPPVLALHAGRSLVGTDDWTGEHNRLDRRCRGQQRLTRTGQNVADGTFTEAVGRDLTAGDREGVAAAKVG